MTFPIVVPSLLAAPFDRLGEAIHTLEKDGIHLFHFDVMDGHFVQNLTMGPVVLHSLQNHVKSTFDVHLMVDNPEIQISWFDLPCVRSISIHIEASSNLAYDLYEIRQRGKKAGAVINPNTPVNWLNPILDKADQILVMSVFPGLGGQDFIPETLESVRYLSRLKQEKDYRYSIQIDGGIHAGTIVDAVKAGAEELIAGNAVFHAPSPTDALRTLKSLIQSAV